MDQSTGALEDVRVLLRYGLGYSLMKDSYIAGNQFFA